jgi:uncharacterized membrane protein YfcA
MAGAFDFTILQVAIVAAIVFVTFIVRGMSGFGAGMVAVPLLVFVVPIHTAVPLMGLLVFVLFVILSIRDRRDVVVEELKLLLPPTLLGVAAGALLFSYLDAAILVKLLAAFIICFAAYTLAVSHFGLPQVRCSGRWAFPVGFAGAGIDTLFGGGGGSLVVIYMHMRGVTRAQFRATVAALWFFEMIARIAGYAVSGHYTASTLVFAALLLPVMLAGTWVGEHIGNRISQRAFSAVLAAMLTLSGVSLLLK